MQTVTIDHSEHSVLRTPAKPVTFPLTQEIQDWIQEVTEFFETLKSPYSKPAGLAATQVGAPWQIIIIQIPPEAKAVRKDVFDTLPPTILINPSFKPLPEEGECKDWEGCYSVPEKMGEVYRYFAITYEAYNVAGERVSGIARGFLARLLQHEIDHLQGKLYIDHLRSDCLYGPLDEMWKIRKKELEEA